MREVFILLTRHTLSGLVSVIQYQSLLYVPVLQS